ncbi:DUF4236 domain-containing protein [Roseivirga sp. BDSF3-8]|uniref:DUF4236 domain-containing protein n=1 Tax=Roseivirga sp. BDSF3-8 TaxID=3241598 RepID=UPI00353217F0
MRFRKSIKIAPGIKLNLSKSGISTTLGGRGLSVNVGKRGTYLNTSIPGTGLSSRQKIGGKSQLKSSRKQPKEMVAQGYMASEPFLQAKKYYRDRTFMASHKWVLLVGIGFMVLFFPIGLLLLGIFGVLRYRAHTSDAGQALAELNRAQRQWYKKNNRDVVYHLDRAYSNYTNPLLVEDIIHYARQQHRYDMIKKYAEPYRQEATLHEV